MFGKESVIKGSLAEMVRIGCKGNSGRRCIGMGSTSSVIRGTRMVTNIFWIFGSVVYSTLSYLSKSPLDIESRALGIHAGSTPSNHFSPQQQYKTTTLFSPIPLGNVSFITAATLDSLGGRNIAPGKQFLSFQHEIFLRLHMYGKTYSPLSTADFGLTLGFDYLNPDRTYDKIPSHGRCGVDECVRISKSPQLLTCRKFILHAVCNPNTSLRYTLNSRLQHTTANIGVPRNLSRLLSANQTQTQVQRDNKELNTMENLTRMEVNSQPDTMGLAAITREGGVDGHLERGGRAYENDAHLPRYSIRYLCLLTPVLWKPIASSHTPGLATISVGFMIAQAVGRPYETAQVLNTISIPLDACFVDRCSRHYQKTTPLPSRVSI
ncbi:uncharacterized protein BDR25DRAFT_357090 [Lindgomyces ingoldianus]|uniref:Uncharacterized protein n=1 Tax=Lindgomyces ingoldianus TaxID=673940 RepID=A0ACB6QNX4_9PLEO|nr:uncharacterized protein BDR25DRAFT_357090 [Lindgomyces ingoldianus]KAF2468724.1 hypothetical protein BDR25DRAFT_357090 [Lindgomyces ingoldianus]